MADRVLVAGGTGAVGRVVVDRLVAAGVPVRVLSRGHLPARATGPVEYAVGDVTTGAGLAEAVRGTKTIVACIDPVERLVETALRAGRPHLVYISIVGVDRIPFGYYQRKLADEKIIGGSGLPWTVLRTTQFHDLIAAALRALSASPVLPLPSGWRFQPIDVDEVGARLADLARGEPAGRVEDMGGPDVLPVDELARRYLSAMGKRRRPILPVSLPGRVAKAFKAGYHLTPDHAVGAVTFDDYLHGLPPGQRPYGEKMTAAVQAFRDKWGKWPARDHRS